MKQTAIEWFQEQIIKIINGTCELSEIEIYEQAKQIEKEQIEDAFNSGMSHSVDYFIPEDDTTEATEYYNQTYNNEA